MDSNRNEILVKGDVSGIQDFIFNVKSDGAAKELKGRSFFVKLLVEVAMQFIFDNSDIQNSDVKNSKISTSGGNFIIKLPATNKEIVNKAQMVFTESLQFTGLNISIVWVDYRENEYGKSIKELNAKTRERKLQFFTNNYDFFIPHKKTNYIYEHAGSEKESDWAWLTNNIKSNQDGSTHFNITKAGKSNTLLITKDEVSLAGYKISFNSVNKGIPLNGYLESLFPFDKQSVKSFESLSKYGQEYDKSLRGANKLAALAMDVDGLGNVIGSLNEEEHRDFDYALKEFFNIKLRNIINTNFRNIIYTVTAGGDDSFFVGKWNTILELAIEINEAFTSYPAFRSKDLTISAGFVIVDPKFPVIRFAQLAERALKKAKYSYETKGNICLFDEVIRWKKLTKINELRKLFRKSRVSGSLLSKARLTAINRIDRPMRLEDFWKMGYYLREITNRDEEKAIMKNIQDNLTFSINASSNLEKRNYRLITPIAARLAELDKRK